LIDSYLILRITPDKFTGYNKVTLGGDTNPVYFLTTLECDPTDDYVNDNNYRASRFTVSYPVESHADMARSALVPGDLPLGMSPSNKKA